MAVVLTLPCFGHPTTLLIELSVKMVKVRRLNDGHAAVGLADAVALHHIWLESLQLGGRQLGRTM